jgi:hypothetical protein
MRLSRSSVTAPSSANAEERIEALARSDPPLALRLMHMANEGESRNGNIVTLRDAVVHVGTRRLVPKPAESMS